ncbi:MAG TPA: sensor histidine kinase [Candidatus Eremiobacteraceae bacterium]|jgi:signal transduction histidine kinase|nr:sensor histidine kinase [Candidatus Eremiobacteraceae bacterium]
MESDLFQRMNSGQDANPSRIDSSASPKLDQSRPDRGLRVILLLGFGGLLALLLYSGANALGTLRDLHNTEEAARNRFLDRGRVLSTVILSTNSYSDHMEEFLLSVTPGDAQTASDDDATRQADQARQALQGYPSDRTDEEAALLAQLQNYIVEEDRAFRSAIAWNAEERRLRGQEMIAREILPRRQGIVTIAEKIELLNNQETIAAKQANFVEFGRLQNNLSEFLMLALISGFLLAVVSAIYILRLERQARFRYAELVNSRTELQQLSARLVDAQETERRAISRELHDEVGQALGLLLMDAGRLSTQLGPGDEKGQEIVRSIKTVAERTVQTVRSMALLLRPSMLDDLGLVPAVEWYAREMSRRGETEVEVRAENISDTLSDPLKLCVYRMVQEALNNANRHAHAKNVTVELKQSANSISVKIEDDGAGFDPKRTRGMGLLGMEERVKRLGGSLNIESRPGTRTIIRAELPIDTTASAPPAPAQS